MGASAPKLAAALAALTFTAAVPAAAHAAYLSLVSRTLYQGSMLRLFPDREIDRFRNLNRFAEWLDIGGYGFGPRAGLDALASVRYRTDFGTGFHRDTPPGAGIPAVDGRDQLEVLYAYLDWRDAIEGRLDLRLGRQLLIDDLDWFSLDGIKATVYPFAGTRFEVYAGQPVPYETFLSSDPFLYDGTQIDDGPELTFGGSATIHGGDLTISAAYRHTFIFRGSELVGGARPGFDEGPAADSLSGGKRGVSEAVFGASLGYVIRPANIDLQAHGVWNLLFGGFDQARLGAGWTPRQSVRAQLEFLRVNPRFVADSIFNYFNLHPYDRGRAEVGLELTRGLWIDAGYFLQRFGGSPKGPRSLATAGNEDPAIRGGEGLEFTGSDVVHGPRAEITYRRELWLVGAGAEASTNFGGRYAYGGNYRMVDLFGELLLLEGRLTTSLRLNYTGAQTDWFEAIDTGSVAPETVSYGVYLGARGKITDNVSARLDLVKNFESVIEGSYRIQSLLEVRYP